MCQKHSIWNWNSSKVSWKPTDLSMVALKRSSRMYISSIWSDLVFDLIFAFISGDDKKEEGSDPLDGIWFGAYCAVSSISALKSPTWKELDISGLNSRRSWRGNLLIIDIGNETTFWSHSRLDTWKWGAPSTRSPISDNVDMSSWGKGCGDLSRLKDDGSPLRIDQGDPESVHPMSSCIIGFENKTVL